MVSIYTIQIECGESFMRAAHDIKHLLNRDGRRAISKFDEAIGPLRHLVEIGDIKGLSANFESVGVAVLRQLEKSTNHNRCLKRVFRQLAELDHNISKQLKQIKSPHDARVIVCYILKYKGKQFRSCKK